MKKRVYVLVPTDHPGGAERMAQIVANALQARGWSVDYGVLARQQAPSFSASDLSPGVRLSFGRRAVAWAGLPGAVMALRGRSYDLVFTTHAPVNAVMSVLAAVGWIRVGRLVARESTTAFDRFTGLKRLAYATLYRLYGAQDLVVAQTRYMAEHVRPHLRARLRARVQVLANPVDLAAIDAAAGQPLDSAIQARLDGRPCILVCGRLIEVKQPLLALETYVALRQALADPPRLVFMGDGPLRASLEAEIAARGLADDVVLLGQQSNPYAVMRHCRYGLLTSSREGFPNVVLEMMACGVRKVVMTPCAGDLDALTGVTVTQDHAAPSLAGALLTAIRDGEDRSAIYRAVVEGRSVERYLDALLDGPAS